MNYSKEELDKLPKKDNFRLRGLDITRLETFMDAAFAFSMTMMVISLGEIPKNYSELLFSIKQIPAFLLSFFVIVIFWLSHRNWSRRYGLEDNTSIFLSISLIFILLVYIYPLRLMFSALFTWISGGWFPSTFQIYQLNEILGLFTVYGFGLFAIALVIALLYYHAYHKRDALQLNEIEVLKTKQEYISLAVVSATGLIAAFLAILLPENIFGLLSSLIYISIPINLKIIGMRFKRRESKIDDLTT